MRLSDQFRDQHPNEREADSRLRQSDRAEPHALANELTDDRNVQARNVPDADSVTATTVSSNLNDEPKRNLVAVTVIAAILLGVIVIGAAATGRWVLIGLAALVIIPYAIILLSPVWLATSTKAAQDHAAAEQSAIKSPVKR